MIHITNAKTDEILSVIHEDEFWSDTHIKKLSLEETFYFETFADRPFAQYLADRNRVIIPDEDGRFVEFIIEEVEQLFDRTKSVYANASYIELRKQRIVDPQSLSSQSATTAVSFALNGTQWQAGNIKYTTLKNVTIEKHMDAYTLLKLIATTFDLELNFRVEVKGSEVTGRYVDLIERVGDWNGREVVFGADLIGVKRVEKTDTVVTALIGLGPDKNDGTPRLEAYVEDLDALQRWGKNGQHLVETYEPQTNNQDMTEAQLQTLTEKELARRINSVVEYESTIANLEAIPGLEHHTVRFGDTIRIKDEGFFPPLYLEARIHTQERSIKVEREKSFVLGDYIEYTAEEVMALFRALQSQINQAMSQREIHTGMTPPEDVSQHWVDISREPNVLKRFDEATGRWVKVTPTEASEVGAATPQEVRDMSETERLKGHKITLLKEKTVIDDKHAYLIVKPQMYSQAVKDELVASKTNLNNMYSALIARIDTAIADEVITTAERANIENATENYRLAIARWEVAYADGEDDVNAGRTADAEQASQDYVEEYAQQKVTQGTIAPSNPVTGDLWIDTTATPHVWKRWSGSAWEKATPTTASEVGAETVEGAAQKAGDAQAAAQAYTQSYANKKIAQSSTAPTSPTSGDLWVDTTTTPHVWKRWSGSAWVKATPTLASEVGAETPSGAQAKADAAKASAESASQSYTETYAQKKVTSGTVAPTSPATGDLWIDTSATPNIWKRWSGSAWVKATPTSASEVGAETPSGAQAKADAAKSASQSYTETYAQKKVTSSTTAPSSPATGDLWIDISKTPNVWKRWSGSAWIKATADAFAELTGTIGANQIAANTITSTMISTAGLDAGVIKTGVLDAGRIRIGPSTQFDANYDPATKETPSGAQSKASAAESSAKSYADTTYGGTKSLVEGWKYADTTFINGGDIYTGTVTANQIASKTITANEIKSGTLTTDLISTVGLDAGVIKTGTLDAGRVKIGATTVFDTNYDPTTKETPSGAQSKANTAKSEAISSANSYADTTYGGTKSLVSGWKYPSTTFIDGGNIYTGTVTANEIASKTITANQIAAETLSSDLIVTAGLDAGVIKFGTMSGDRILANSLQGDRIVAGSLSANAIGTGYLNVGSSQLVKGTDVRDGVVKAHLVSSGLSVSAPIVFGEPYLKVNQAEATFKYVYFERVPLANSKQVTISVETKHDSSLASGAFLWLLASNTELSASNKESTSYDVSYSVSDTTYTTVQDIADGWKRYTRTITLGASVKSGFLRLDHRGSTNGSDTAARYRNIMVNYGTIAMDWQPHTDEDIGIGSIKAKHIATQSITSEMIATTGLDAGVIKFGTMSGDRILANTINADRLKAGTVIANDITFTGTLSGATGTYSGKLTGAIIEVENPSAGYTYLNFKQGTQVRKVQFGGNGSDAFLKQVGNPTYGDWNLDNFYVNASFSRFYGNALFYSGYNGEMKASVEGTTGNFFGNTFEATGGVKVGSSISADINSGVGALYFRTADNALRVRGNSGAWGNVYSEQNVKNGTARATYTANSILDITVNHMLAVVPSSIILTLKWVSGAVSTAFCEKLYVENVTSTSFTIKVRDDGNRFASGDYIDVYWEAKRF